VTNFFWGQPALNYGFAKINRSWQLPPTHPDCVATKNALIDAMRFWLEMGVDGYRVDMAASLIKHDDAKGTATQKLWQDIFGKLRKDFPEAVMISEWFKPECAVSAGFDIDFAHIVSSTPHGKMFRAEKNANVHYSPGDKPWCNFEGISYFDRKGQGDAKEFFDEFAGMRRKLRKKGLVGWLTSNHDIARISVNRSMKEIELVFAFVLTMPGVPFIYYGDEIGMKYLDLPSKEGGYTRTGSRTPMQWNGKKNAGFSSGSAKELYLPIDPDANRPTVEAQEKDPKSLLNTVRRLSELRHAMPALAGDADYAELFIKKHQYPIVYLRRRGKNRVLIAINPSGKPASAKFAVPGSVKGYATLAGSHVTLNKAGASFRLDLPATSYTIVDLG
jgi:maltose alpha-D-glucosyltransferase/alpha-amylase